MIIYNQIVLFFCITTENSYEVGYFSKYDIFEIEVESFFQSLSIDLTRQSNFISFLAIELQ